MNYHNLSCELRGNITKSIDARGWRYKVGSSPLAQANKKSLVPSFQSDENQPLARLGPIAPDAASVLRNHQTVFNMETVDDLLGLTFREGWSDHRWGHCNYWKLQFYEGCWREERWESTHYSRCEFSKNIPHQLEEASSAFCWFLIFPCYIDDNAFDIK